MKIASFAIAGAAFAVMLGGVLYAAVYRSGTPSSDASLVLSDLSLDKEGAAYRADTSTIRLAVAAVISPRVTLENYEGLASYLSDRLGRPVELVQGKSYAEINSLVRSGDVALALVCSGAYVVGNREFGMEPLVVPVVNGATTYRSYLIVSYGSPLRDWEDLRDRTFAFTDPLSNSGRLVPVYVLHNMGETPEKFFRDSIFTYSHDKSIEAVANGLVDAAAVDSLVYDFMWEHDPGTVAKTTVLWKSPPYGINPVVVHPWIDPSLRLQLRSALLEMGETPEGRAVLTTLGIDAFAPPEPGAYESIEQMIDATATR